MSLLSTFGNLVKGAGSKFKTGWNAGDGVLGSLKAGAKSVGKGLKSADKFAGDINNRLLKEGFGSIGQAGKVTRAEYGKAAAYTYGRRVGIGAAAGGVANAMTGVASDEDTGLLGRFAKGAVMGGAIRGTFAGKFGGVNLRKQFWSSNQALNKMIRTEGRFAGAAKYAADKGGKLSRADWEKAHEAHVKDVSAKRADRVKAMKDKDVKPSDMEAITNKANARRAGANTTKKAPDYSARAEEAAFKDQGLPD